MVSQSTLANSSYYFVFSLNWIFLGIVYHAIVFLLLFSYCFNFSMTRIWMVTCSQLFISLLRKKSLKRGIPKLKMKEVSHRQCWGCETKRKFNTEKGNLVWPMWLKEQSIHVIKDFYANGIHIKKWIQTTVISWIGYMIYMLCKGKKTYKPKVLILNI